MSMTYANANTETRAEETFVPRYARPAKSTKSVKTWMILAPIGAVVLLGAGVAMMMGGGEQAALAPAAEATAPRDADRPGRDERRPGAGCSRRPGRARSFAHRRARPGRAPRGTACGACRSPRRASG